MPETPRPSLEELGINPQPETEDKHESSTLYLEIIGDIDPASLTREEFEEKAWLFHGARNPNFRVEDNFDYRTHSDDATLGNGLYTTTDMQLATNYALNRPGGTLWKLMPYQAKMFNFTDNERVANVSVPKKLVLEWIDFAQPQILERAKDSSRHDQDSLIDILQKMSQLPGKDFVDLRGDILNTHGYAFSAVDDIWRNFCAQKGVDGVIFVEGGDHHTTRKDDKSYVFYNPNAIGTYEDWQQRATAAEVTEGNRT